MSHFMPLVLLSAALVFLPGKAPADDIEDLQAEIALLRVAVGSQVSAWLEPQHFRVDLRMRPLERFFAALSLAPPAKRSVRMNLTAQSGQLVGWSEDCMACLFNKCWKYGDRTAFAEFFDINGGGATIDLENVRASWTGTALAVSGRVNYDAFIPMIKTYLDLTCVGGGLQGPSFGPTTCKDGATFNVMGAIGLGTRELLKYDVNLNSGGDIHIKCSTSLGEVGTLNFAVKEAINQNLSGEIGGTLRHEGVLKLELGGQPINRPFQIELRSPGVYTSASGVSARTNVDLQWR